LSTRAVRFGPLKRFNLANALGKRLVIQATDDPASTVLTSFFRAYDEAFVLPNEKESLEGFKECLALNQGMAYASLSSLYGPFREIVLVMAEAATGELIGGANFIVFPLELSQPVLSLNLNYVFVDPILRRQGYFGELLKSVHLVARAAFEPLTQALPVIVFIEQNDPFRMNSQDYVLDTGRSGLDQITRIEIWSKLGARIIDFDYVQPPLSRNQQPDHNLVYGVLGGAVDGLDSCLLLEHLKRFFGISVLKGADLGSDPVASAQLSELRSLCAFGKKIPLLQAGALSAKKDQIYDTLYEPGGLRAFLRTSPA
jgi:hypothetical protein